MPKALLELPEVGHLPHKGGTVNPAQGKEPHSRVPAKEEIDALVGVYAEELAYNLDSQNLRAVKLRSGATPTDAAPLKPVVDETEDGDDEGVNLRNEMISGAIPK